MQFIPNTLTRLQVKAFVQNAELAHRGRDSIIRLTKQQLGEEALHKLINDCIKSEGGYMGYQGQTLSLDCYIVTPQEMDQIISAALIQGRKDATFEMLEQRKERVEHFRREDER